MKKLIMYLFVFVLLFELVYAGEIFSEEVKDNVQFKVNGITHVARYYPAAKKVSLLAGTERILVEVGDCDDIGALKYCFDSAEEGINEETGEAASTMDLRVLQSGPDISIDRDVTDSDPNLNEEVEITATVSNIGNERASNVVYEDKFPFSVKVSGAYYNSATNGVAWTGSIDKNKSQTIKYKVRIAEFAEFDSSAEASYVWNGKVNKVKSDSIHFSVQTPYTISDSISAKSVDIGDEISYNISINNTDSSQDLNIDGIRVVLPKDVTTSYRDMGWEVESDGLSYSDILSAGEGKRLSFRLKSLKPVQGKLTATAEMRAGNKKFTETFEHTIGIGVSEILPEIKLEPAIVKGGGELEVEAKITNYGEDAIAGISLNMASDMVGNSGWRDLELAPGKHHYAFNKIISAPSIDAEKNYYVMLSGSYETASGKTMMFETKKEVTVTPQERVVELTPVVVMEGRDVNVTLNIRNVADYTLTYISLIDSFPTGFKVSSGEQYADIDELGIGEERTAYSYIVRLPEAYAKKSFEITHTFNALDKDESKIMYEKKTAVQLAESPGESSEAKGNETAAEANATAPAGETQETAAGEADKPGIFKRMWRWIKGLFGNEDKPEEKFE